MYFHACKCHVVFLTLFYQTPIWYISTPSSLHCPSPNPPFTPSPINIHLLHNNNVLITRQLLHSNVLTDLLPRNNLLVQHRRRALRKLITPLLPPSLIRFQEVSKQRRLLRRDHTNIHITPAPQVVEYTRFYRLCTEIYSLVSVQLALPFRFECRHGCHGSRTHGHIG